MNPEPAPPEVHPSAVVHDGATLGPGCRVGPFVVVEADVTVGAQSVLEAGTVLQRGSRVGARCRLGPYATVGGEPMDTKFRGEPSYAVLEDEVVLREFASVHRASGEGQATRVGRKTLVMAYAHVSHNVQVGQGCVLTTQVQLGGHSEVGDFAVLGSAALLHQGCRVGAYAMYGAGSAANQDILPYSMARGNPARHYRLNRVGLTRHGVTGERYRALERAVRAFRRRDWALLEALALESAEVRTMLDFRARSKRGLCGFV
ncbi:acyl-(acyl-carrier-protein)--UDP-N-acetylglucosamine O-acyltransferase [Truepera radiovictrix DSM 17093]|uniref:Acyl-(Acyl-carrier-protein)--UDP-N-acetylglucosamine O-acyltransferase n=1 Tax=Truepera radiovictrix (strain DSM 17093 / CIP 108686 / LMG 22925 / RQ-24) TaxID=649638 RepID=D7CRG1_TRURR|nr:acyl-(acyl-carrier-protein)--UDP-N-acetylglucosamine O-acyltransferase [Truepera radiovictrix DSM 17093]